MQEEPEPDCSPLPSLGEKCDSCMSKDAVLKVLNYRDYEIGVYCEDCISHNLPHVVDALDRSWPF